MLKAKRKLRDLYIHIGYAKAGTTTLQESIFPHVPTAKYFGRTYEYKDGTKVNKRNFEWVYSLSFDADFDSNTIDSDIIESRNTINIISHEVLLRPYRWHRALLRIKAAFSPFFNVKIILSIRSQPDIIISRLYHTNKKFNNSIDFSKSLDFEGVSDCRHPYCAKGMECVCKNNNGCLINLPFYNYFAMLVYLQSIFGHNNVHVLVLEALKEKQDFQKELSQLLCFLNIDVSPEHFECGYSNKQHSPAYTALLQRFKDSDYNNRIINYYSLFNQHLEIALSRSLEGYGYPLKIASL